MPYINKDRRDIITPETAGELNYLLTRLCRSFAGDTPNYESYNSIVGALEACKLEFYRRAIAPYEDQKAFENGDVYDTK